MLSRGAKVVGIALLLALVVWWLRSYRISEYRGDGKITDTGMWNYPRYHIELGQIPLFEAATHEFKLIGLPSEKMSFELMIAERTGDNRAELTRLKTKIEATLQDNKGRTICKAVGIPSDGIRENAWILTSTEHFAAYYNRSCVEVSIQRSIMYTLTLRLSEVNPNSPRIYLVPILSGGGNELP